MSQIDARAELNLATNGHDVRFSLDRERTTLGNASSDIVVDDPTVSRLHAVIERVTGGWVLQDLGSRNGTFVNGTRISGARTLHHGDEIRLGSTAFVFRASPTNGSGNYTAPLESAPQLTRREHDALVALCRPILLGTILDEPATLTDVALELTISQSAAKKLLGRAYDKFLLIGEERRRGRLAAEALRRGAVSRADLR